MSKIDIVQSLKEGNTVQIYPLGSSMMPFIYPSRDAVVISPLNKEIRKNDIVLFRSKETELLTLHRIVKIKEQTYYACGDNQYHLEPVCKDQILGVVTEIIRNGRRINTDDPGYRSLAQLYIKNKHLINVLRKLRNRFFSI